MSRPQTHHNTGGVIACMLFYASLWGNGKLEAAMELMKQKPKLLLPLLRSYYSVSTPLHTKCYTTTIVHQHTDI